MSIAKLIPVSSPDNPAKKEARLQGNRVSIGRAPGNAVVLDDREVSKYHAEIVQDADGYLLCDLNSSNGTFVNGSQIKRHRLENGDLVELGASRFHFIETEAEVQPVAIVPQSPIDRTTVLAASKLEDVIPAKEIRDADQLRKTYDQVRTAFEAVQKLLNTTDLEQLCKAILDVAFKLLKAESGAVLLFDEQHQLVPWAHRGVQNSGERVIISRTIIDQVLSKRAAVLASDALTDSRWGSSQSVVMSGLRSLMCVPLASGDNVFGILHIGNSKEVGAFAPGDMELIKGVGVGAGLALSNAFLTHRLAEEARTRESLGRFLSPVLVEQVLQRQLDLKRGGNEAEVTVMFADIRGFTPMTERHKATEIVALLNEYFDQMVEVIFRLDGILDKFIGDAIMAVWGAPLSYPDDALKAVTAAREMQSTLVSFNEFRKDKGDDPLAIGIGLASGRAVAGAIGARRRMEFTVIGDAVNLASRLAGLAKGGQVLIDEETWKRAGSPEKGVKALPPAQVKGKTKPVPVFEVE